MIIFHEGLPRSGKSYEAMAVRIIPAIKAGRSVVAYVEGINHEQIAQLAGIEVEKCREMLTAVTREQMQTIHTDKNSGKILRVEDHIPTLAKDNALIVLDEAQNFWSNKAKLGAEMTQFITEHGHRGIDIILMGQDLRDVHAVWRRRVEIKLCFLKLNGLSLPPWAARLFGKVAKPSYSVTTYRHLGGDQFSRSGMTITAYDPKYFGTYKSFVAADTNTEVYTDKRAQVWSNPVLRFAVPVSIGLACWGLWSAWAFFHPKDTAAETSATKHQESPPHAKAASSAPAAAPEPATQAMNDQRSPIERRMQELSGKARIRLAGLVTMKDRTSGIIEWIEGGSVVTERLTLDALRTMGVSVIVSGDMVQLIVGDFRELATPWPLEQMGRATAAQQHAVRGPQSLAGAAPMPEEIGAGAAPPTFRDLPGSITREPTVGTAIRDAARGG